MGKVYGVSYLKAKQLRGACHVLVAFPGSKLRLFSVFLFICSANETYLVWITPNLSLSVPAFQCRWPSSACAGSWRGPKAGKTGKNVVCQTVYLIISSWKADKQTNCFSTVQVGTICGFYEHLWVCDGKILVARQPFCVKMCPNGTFPYICHIT